MSFPANPILEAAPYGPVPVLPVLGFQGGTYSVRGVQPQALVPSATRSSTFSTALQHNPGYRGLMLAANVPTNPGGSQTLTFVVRCTDGNTGQTFDILTVPATITPGGVWQIYPGLSGAAVEGVALTRNLHLPEYWLLVITHSGAGNWVYSVGAMLLP